VKQCCRCDEWKPFDEFNVDKSKSDGHVGACKACRNGLVMARSRLAGSKPQPKAREASSPECRVCFHCDIEQPYNQFFKKENGRYGAICKTCRHLKYLEDIGPRPLVRRAILADHKICLQCDSEKPHCEFQKNGTSPDGKIRLRNICKECFSENRRRARAATTLYTPQQLVTKYSEITGYKYCSGCDSCLLVDMFNPIIRDGKIHHYSGVCTKCTARRSFANAIARTHGLSLETYAWKLYTQDFKCPLCERRFFTEVSPHIDHDHEAEKRGVYNIRAILCSQCNLAYGLLGEDPNAVFNMLLFAEQNQKRAELI
jgi:hypothetical protein